VLTAVFHVDDKDDDTCNRPDSRHCNDEPNDDEKEYSKHKFLPNVKDLPRRGAAPTLAVGY